MPWRRWKRRRGLTERRGTGSRGTLARRRRSGRGAAAGARARWAGCSSGSPGQVGGMWDALRSTLGTVHIPTPISRAKSARRIVHGGQEGGGSGDSGVRRAARSIQRLACPKLRVPGLRASSMANVGEVMTAQLPARTEFRQRWQPPLSHASSSPPSIRAGWPTSNPSRIGRFSR